MRLAAGSLALALALAGGCDAEPGESFEVVVGGDRPALVQRPPSYSDDRPAPLIIGLHGYGSTGERLLEYTRIDELLGREYVMVVAPDGQVDGEGRQFWNGTDACCDFDGSGVDDVGYLVGLVDEIAAELAVDLDRVFVFGFSAGGFMGYRAACDRADRFAAVVSFAGASFLDPAACEPSEPVAILHVHGDLDPAILYQGAPDHPGAPGSAERWAGYNDCNELAEVNAERLDLDAAIAGAETRVDRYAGCDAGGAVELWTLEGSRHTPEIDDSLALEVWGWLEQETSTSVRLD